MLHAMLPIESQRIKDGSLRVPHSACHTRNPNPNPNPYWAETLCRESALTLTLTLTY